MHHSVNELMLLAMPGSCIHIVVLAVSSATPSSGHNTRLEYNATFKEHNSHTVGQFVDVDMQGMTSHKHVLGTADVLWLIAVTV